MPRESNLSRLALLASIHRARIGYHDLAQLNFYKITFVTNKISVAATREKLGYGVGISL